MNSGRTKLAILVGALLLLLVAGGGAAYFFLGADDPDEVAEKSDQDRDEVNEGPGGEERIAKNVDKPQLSKAEKARRDALKRREAAIKARARQKREAGKETGERVEGEEAEEADAVAGQETDETGESEDAEADGEQAAKEAEIRRVREAEEARKKAEESAKEPTRNKQDREDWKTAVLQIITNFDKADITINGIDYPEYLDPGEPEGVVLPAGGPYDVRVTYNGNTKAYRVNLRPNETRLLMVELTGFSGKAGKAAPPTPRPPPKREAAEEKKEEKKEEAGKVTVYSKPSGTIIIDGNKQSEKTPGTVEVENGRHEVQVEYEHGEMSEKKIIRVRQGSRIKLFFRARNPPK